MEPFRACEVCPWERLPFQLIGWWDMQKFAAENFMIIVRALADLENEVKAYENESSEEKIKRVDGWTGLWDAIGHQCKKLGLRISLACVEDIKSDLDAGMSSDRLMAAIGELENTLRREMENTQFFHMPTKQADFYGQKELFGLEVNTKFPSIQFDMEESGNCYAMGRGTACVFHLMRIMEVGVQQFGTKLGVNLVTEKNWQNILDEINKAIKVLPKSPSTVDMSQAAANLYAVKLAWRNEVMHPNDTYTLEEAENLIRQVKIFMSQLAAIV